MKKIVLYGCIFIQVQIQGDERMPRTKKGRRNRTAIKY